MKPLIEEVLKLQPLWSHLNTPEMQRRGQLIRHEMPEWLELNRTALASVMRHYSSDLEFEGRDGTGPKSEIPWVRFYSASHSPSAHQGWYCVYLFEATGAGAYLCLDHGSTRYENGEFKPRSSEELSDLVSWARESLGEEIFASGRITKNISLNSTGSLGRAYERGTVCSIFYGSGEVPSENILSEDAVTFAGLLARLYDAEDLGRSPEGIAFEAEIAQDAVEAIAAPLRLSRAKGQGFGLSHAERMAIDRHAMSVALQHLKVAGYSVEDVSKNHPYDFLASKNGHKIIVEVKGTTGGLRTILLTANEVAAHKHHHPDNALIVVHSIELDRLKAPPFASGGAIHIALPWVIEDAALKPLSFQYRLPD